MTFSFGEKVYKCCLSQIQLRQNGRLGSQENLRIYDSFTNIKNENYYLVDYKDDNPFWASENQLSKEAIEYFNSNQISLKTSKIRKKLQK